MGIKQGPCSELLNSFWIEIIVEQFLVVTYFGVFFEWERKKSVIRSISLKGTAKKVPASD